MSDAQIPIGDNLTYDSSKNGIIGRGRYGIVFHGTYFGQKVAVKRIQQIEVNLREEANLRKLDHENVVKLMCQEENNDFRYRCNSKNS